MSSPAKTLTDAATPLPPTPSSALVPKKPLIMRLGKYLQPRINNIVAKSSRIGNHPFYQPTDFPWIAEFEARWREIQAEASVVLQDLNKIPPLAEISPDHRRIAPAGKWRSFFLCGYGYRVEANCDACPKTAAMIAKVPGLNSALFSILAPGTHIPPHTGVTKAFLTCHLGLKVPQKAEDCAMHVDGQRVTWSEGKAIVFDDMYQHEVLNDTDEIRVVLLVQFRRPMRPVGWILGNLFLWGVKRSRFVQQARRGVEQWKMQDPPAVPN
ncbi:aspartyl/asparaginyl beta-hydroxylase domain-containing protein [uncultured Sphingomonas sp.]|uniref:aspartyl/asparaginyl beta-hydroxylase domain-containing protein n=1 Tax=uncultured Sphingomonas sp. TaxID=158754 RepID=UPI00262E65FE|nr:aspartyl/asparaginyl beta-hydroxylase domain-containing protein [uncultured Sphingomonas sp.]